MRSEWKRFHVYFFTRVGERGTEPSLCVTHVSLISVPSLLLGHCPPEIVIFPANLSPCSAPISVESPAGSYSSQLIIQVTQLEKYMVKIMPQSMHFKSTWAEC